MKLSKILVLNLSLIASIFPGIAHASRNSFRDLPAVDGGGSLIGNGGDTLLCEASSNNHFQGHYTLDYLLKYRSEEPLAPWSGTLAGTVHTLRNYFSSTYPEMLPIFNDFMEGLRSENSNASRRWIESRSTLQDVKDEEIVNLLPSNCLRSNAEGKREPNLFQTVIRKASMDPIEYHYDRSILDMQEQQNPLQYSFFIIHEWLWDITQDVEVVRKMNWLLHSPRLMNYNRKDFINLVDGLKLFQVQLAICERTHVIQKNYTKSCHDMNLSDLRGFETLNVQNLSKDFVFRPGDFYGFSRVKSLSIQAANISEALTPRVFQPLYMLRSLDLAASRGLTTIGTEWARDLDSLETLKIYLGPQLFGPGTTDIENLPKNLKTLFLVTSDHESFTKIRSLILKSRPELNVSSGLP